MNTSSSDEEEYTYSTRGSAYQKKYRDKQKNYIGLVTSTTNVTNFLNENISVKTTKNTIFNNPFETDIIMTDNNDDNNDNNYLELNSNNINITDNNDKSNTSYVEKEDSDSESNWSDISDENDEIDDELNNGNSYFYSKMNFHQVKILNTYILKLSSLLLYLLNF